MPTPDEYRSFMHATIEARGLFIQAVLADGSGPGYHYTVGLTALGHPELCAFSLSDTVAWLTFTDAHERILAGERFVADRDRRLALGPLSGVALREVPDEHTLEPGCLLAGIGSYAGYVGWTPPTEGPVALQVCWTRDGSMPWEHTCVLRAQQPVLTEGDPPHARTSSGPIRPRPTGPPSSRAERRAQERQARRQEARAEQRRRRRERHR